ncbi:hypothetical protein N7486_005053 [Penicillium sp. IBT 16267x]|nr:hypothetical protein N7486_005053 [Penicillium sp. IBT 16267x]
MSERHEIQQAIEARWDNRGLQENNKRRDIQQAVNPVLAEDAERTTRESGQDLISENLDPTGKHYPFRVLQKNKQAERVVHEWFKVRSQLLILILSDK